LLKSVHTTLNLWSFYAVLELPLAEMSAVAHVFAIAALVNCRISS